MSSTTGVLAAIDLTLALLSRAQQISTLVAQAQAAGRDLQSEEWAVIQAADDQARQGLVEAIAAAKAAGR